MHEQSRPGSAWIVVNGVRRPLPDGCSLLQLMRELGMTSDGTLGVAVAVNDQVIRRADWPVQRLAADDRVEIVKPVQGG